MTDKEGNVGYETLGAQASSRQAPSQYVDIVTFLGRKCTLNVAGVGNIQRIPLSVFIIGGGRHSQPTIHCSSWDGALFEQYPLVSVKGIQ